jgi:hypothetical protein
VIRESSGTLAGEPTAQLFTIGSCWAISAPRNLMFPRSSRGLGSRLTGVKPWPVYSKATSEPSGRGMGRKRPVEALLTASIFWVATSKR